MARIVIASASEATRDQLYHMLSSAGHSLFRCCASEGELRRALDACEDGIVILAGLFPGMSADELNWDYGDRIRILLIAKPDVLAHCETEGIFRLTFPISGQAVLGAVEMLIQLHQMSLPKRRGTERELVEQAKEILMRQLNLTEPEAHRYLQKHAMNHGMKMSDYAAWIVSHQGG